MSSSNNNTLGHIVVFGNEKGGCGKSTAAMHATIALMRLGYTVGTMDLDARQGSFTRYLTNRFHHVLRGGAHQPIPNHIPISNSDEKTESVQFFMAVESLAKENDFVVIDTPGADSHLSRLAHRHADTIVTPVNDSLIDLDVLADINPDSLVIRGASVYARSVMAAREYRKKVMNRDTRWIVMRNRVSTLVMKSKRDIETILQSLSPRLGFDYITGFSERLAFRDMFLKGLTLLDLDSSKMSATQLSAKQEVSQLVRAIVPDEKRYALIRRRSEGLKVVQTAQQGHGRA